MLRLLWHHLSMTRARTRTRVSPGLGLGLGPGPLDQTLTLVVQQEFQDLLWKVLPVCLLECIKDPNISTSDSNLEELLMSKA